MEIWNILWHEEFFRNAAVSGLIASVICGLVGPIVLVKRISAIAGGIAHSVLGGMGVAVYLGLNPIFGAFVSALLSAIIIGFFANRNKRYEEVIINALWALGMAIGIMCIAKTPGYNVDLNSYLFGNILMVSTTTIWQSVAVAGTVTAFILVFYKQMLAFCFDSEFALLRGVKIQFLNVALLAIVALAVVVLMQIVGLIMVIALLSLPAASAMLFLHSLGKIMLASTLVGSFATITGLLISYWADLPAGATITMVASAIFIACFATKSLIDRAQSTRTKADGN